MSADANQDRPTHLSLIAADQQLAQALLDRAATPLFKMLDWNNYSPYQRHAWAPPGTPQPPLDEGRALVPCGYGYHLTDAARAFFWQAPLCYPVDTGGAERMFHSEPDQPGRSPMAPKWVVRQATLAPAVSAWGPAAWWPATLRLVAGAVRFQPNGLGYSRIFRDFEIVSIVLDHIQDDQKDGLRVIFDTDSARCSPEAASLINNLGHLSRSGWFDWPTPKTDSQALVWECYSDTLAWICNTHKSLWWYHRTHPVIAWGAQWVQAILTTGTVPATEPEWDDLPTWRQA